MTVRIIDVHGDHFSVVTNLDSCTMALFRTKQEALDFISDNNLTLFTIMNEGEER